MSQVIVANRGRSVQEIWLEYKGPVPAHDLQDQLPSPCVSNFGGAFAGHLLRQSELGWQGPCGVSTERTVFLVELAWVLCQGLKHQANCWSGSFRSMPFHVDAMVSTTVLRIHSGIECSVSVSETRHFGPATHEFHRLMAVARGATQYEFLESGIDMASRTRFSAVAPEHAVQTVILKPTGSQPPAVVDIRRREAEPSTHGYFTGR
ncbi:hypothetical protein NOR_01159 [Metarhizium rileyi]|uniref:Uncharacterized protein n=1 Tax=Metarhizium rileyi (strain RCEF 4871) TaxID=1649241 RepID=A0A167IMT1_METRR|nr:hypothetical protein NOR_01159 [Metarhizium rileyi RCEF 4871]